MLSPAEIISRHARPGPRYTSYPTAPAWRTDLGEEVVAQAYAGLEERVSLYVHVPFCKEQCLYCGCNMVVSGRQQAGDRYLDALARVIESLPLPRSRYALDRLHLGGGTPTWLNAMQLVRLWSIVDSRFDRDAGTVQSVEADPAVTTRDQLDALVELGLARISIGVQSFDPVVLEAVQRPQLAGQVETVIRGSREAGIRRINMDLMYGLPFQTPERFAGDLARAIELRPDRFAVFGYAHVPWLKSHQSKMPAEAMPGPQERLALYLMAHERLTAAGYEAIGLDHFALPDDPLSVARREGKLGRDFMGYTTRNRHQLIGVGMSAISELPDHYLQQRAGLGRWYQAAEGKEPMLEKGLLLSAEDQLRRDVIMGIMCNLALDTRAIEAAHQISFADHFASELAALAPLEEEGLVQLEPGRIVVPTEARLLVRHVAAAFDPAMQKPTEGRYSQVV